jgi:SAM-dependent methyltransferase
VTGQSSIDELLQRFGLGENDRAAWEASGLPSDAFADWLTDRVARRPTGVHAREIYGADDVHDFARRAILDVLAPGQDDRLLEIGCGGGLLLREARATGAATVGLDHSEEMVRLARERAPGAEVVLGRAEELPFADGSFTAVAMSIVFLFLADPLTTLRECHRVLAPGAASPSTRPVPSCAARPPPPSRWPATATSTTTPSSPHSPAKPASPTPPSSTTAAASSSPPAGERAGGGRTLPAAARRPNSAAHAQPRPRARPDTRDPRPAASSASAQPPNAAAIVLRVGHSGCRSRARS